MTSQHDLVLVVDFGAQYAQLIARRVRDAHVYSEIIGSEASVEEILARRPSAIILSGGPSSVYADDAPQVDPALFEAGIPVFGICYGFQVMARPWAGRWPRPGSASTVARPCPSRTVANSWRPSRTRSMCG